MAQLLTNRDFQVLRALRLVDNTRGTPEARPIGKIKIFQHTEVPTYIILEFSDISASDYFVSNFAELQKLSRGKMIYHFCPFSHEELMTVKHLAAFDFFGFSDALLTAITEQTLRDCL